MSIKSVIGCYRGLKDQLTQGKKVKLGLGLDNYFVMAPGEILVMMARAGVGKTAWACNVTHNLIEQGYQVLFFSLEMTSAQILLRLLQLYYGLPKAIVEEGIKDEGVSFMKEFTEFATDLHIEEQNNLDVGDIRLKTNQVNPDVIVIDYLQYIRGYGNSPYEKATNTILALKGLAKSEDIPIIVLSQTSRAGGSGDTPVSMNMARDTGAIEETADYLLGAWRDEKGEIPCKILKNRHGPFGTILYNFEPHIMRFNYRGNGGY